MRIDKYLSDILNISRKDVKSLFKSDIYVNDKLVKDSSYNLCNGDIIKYNSNEYLVEEYVYYILNKPSGYISSTVSSKEGISLLEIILDKRELMIAGRLDKDTEGLIVVTNDGDLIHLLTSPKKELYKTYFVKFSGEYKKELNIEEEFNKGFLLNGEVTLPAEFSYLGNNECLVKVKEGRFHQVKLMCEHFNLHVEYLKRIKIGNLSLDNLNLEIGKYKKVSKEELLKEVF